ncbi:unnamed protein product [Linum tenue]|uniref:Uncharacterized protein n=1 Tax=Linum tenue TaxID=586396 RepID=A0AAV0GU51_9ROSI|nr:unnamed protein product [Linum tenue]
MVTSVSASTKRTPWPLQSISNRPDSSWAWANLPATGKKVTRAWPRDSFSTLQLKKP